MAELIKIWLKRAMGGPMDAMPQARAVAGRGLEGNAEQGGKRQVTLIDAAAWSRVEESLAGPLDPSARRANLMVRGIDLEQSRGRVLRVGESRILIRGETRPCRQMDETCPGLVAALSPNWRGGVYGEVLTGGDIAVGDPVAWEPASAGDPESPMQ